MVFLYAFFPRETIILFPVAKKTRKKKRDKMVLCFYFTFNHQAVHIENESSTSIKWQSTRQPFKSKT